MSIEWYAIHTYVGHEDKVKKNILSRARSLGIADKIYQVAIPTEESVEHGRGGKKEVVERKLFPGYIFVQMDLGDNPEEPNEAWEVVRYTPGVTGFVGTSTRAVPLSIEEEARMPTRPEVIQATQASLIFVVITAIFLLVADTTLGALIDFLIIG